MRSGRRQGRFDVILKNIISLANSSRLDRHSRPEQAIGAILDVACTCGLRPSSQKNVSSGQVRCLLGVSFQLFCRVAVLE